MVRIFQTSDMMLHWLFISAQYKWCSLGAWIYCYLSHFCSYSQCISLKYEVLVTIIYTFNPNNQEKRLGSRALWVWGQSGLHSKFSQPEREALSQEKRQSIKTPNKKATKNQIQKEFCPIIFGHNSKRVKVLIVILFKYIYYSYYYYTILHIR